MIEKIRKLFQHTCDICEEKIPKEEQRFQPHVFGSTVTEYYFHKDCWNEKIKGASRLSLLLYGWKP